MNTINNPLIIERRKSPYEPIILNKTGEQSGEYVDKALAEELLEVVEERLSMQGELEKHFTEHTEYYFILKNLILKAKG